MKILQICSYYSSRLYSLLFGELRAQGVEQNVFYPAVVGTDFPQEKSVIFSACYGQPDRIFFIKKERKILNALYSACNVDSYNVTHAHSLFTNGYIALDIKRRYGTPYLVAVRNSDVNEFFGLRPWLRALGAEIMDEADKVIFLSPAYRDSVINKYVPKQKRDRILSKSLVIPNGINELFIDDVPLRPRIEDGVIRVIQAGDVNRNKNQVAVAAACQKLIGQGYQVSFRVVGRIKDRRVAAALHRYNFIDVAGPRSQASMPQEYRDADIFVMPSHHETFGLTYVEAMSQGLPVIYSKGQGFDGHFTDGKVGYAVSADDVDSLAARMLQCYENRGQYFSGNISRSHAFDWCKIAAKYITVYELSAGHGAIGVGTT